MSDFWIDIAKQTFPLLECSGKNCWFFNRLSTLQKVSGRVFTYIQVRAFDGYIAQLYIRGERGICDLEYRSYDIDELINTCEEWLQKYNDGDKQHIHSDYYSPHNLKGYWAIEYPKLKSQWS